MSQLLPQPEISELPSNPCDSHEDSGFCKEAAGLPFLQNKLAMRFKLPFMIQALEFHLSIKHTFSTPSIAWTNPVLVKQAAEVFGWSQRAKDRESRSHFHYPLQNKDIGEVPSPTSLFCVVLWSPIGYYIYNQIRVIWVVRF